METVQDLKIKIGFIKPILFSESVLNIVSSLNNLGVVKIKKFICFQSKFPLCKPFPKEDKSANK